MANVSINSVQNGILMLAHIHQMFASYLVSINPDVSVLPYTYKDWKTNNKHKDGYYIKLFAFPTVDGILQELI